MDPLITAALEQVLNDICTPAAVRTLEEHADADHDLLRQLLSAGYADALIAESQGGAGLALNEAYALIEACGRYALPVPLPETLLARAVLSANRLARPDGWLTMACAAVGDTAVAPASGVRAISVRGARYAQAVLVQAQDEVRLLPVSAATQEPDLLGADATLVWPHAVWDEAPRLAGRCEVLVLQALVYAALTAGALGEVLRRSLDYANQRQQFGKPIAKFQAIQHQLSVMAEHVYAARMAAQQACAATGLEPDPLRVAVAKARTAEAALEVAALAHSIHGAIGFTEEFDLQLYTRRLLLWRQTAGSESYWHDRVGAAVLAQSGGVLDVLRRVTDPVSG